MAKKLTFEEWQMSVKTNMLNHFGVEPDDIPDYDYATAYEEGYNPYFVAKAAVHAANFF